MVSTMKVWLDDVRDPPDNTWTHVKTASEAILLLRDKSPDVISLDHDLGDSLCCGSGYDVALWIEAQVNIDNTYTPPNVLVHSMNPVGSKNIHASITSIDRVLSSRRKDA